MKLIVAGGRNFKDEKFLYECLGNLDETEDITEIVSGGAEGADALGEKYAKEFSIPLKKFPADWKAFGNSAGPIRNKKMAQYADAVALFSGGKGTNNMYEIAKECKLIIFDYR